MFSLKKDKAKADDKKSLAAHTTQRRTIKVQTEYGGGFSFSKIICHFFSLIGAALTFIRNLIANTVMLLLILLVVCGYYAFSDFKEEIVNLAKQHDEKPMTQDAKILYLPLKGTISEVPFSKSQFDVIYRELGNSIKGEGSHELLAIERALRLAAEDGQIEKVILDLQGTRGLSMANVQRLGLLLDKLQKKNKEVIATATVYTQTNYALATHADVILLDPIGEVSLRGIGINNLYFKELLDKIMVRPYIFRAGELKSAVEPFMQNSMSDPVKKEYQDLAAKLWDVYLQSLGNRTDLDKNMVLPDATSYAGTLAFFKGDKATMQLEHKLIDKLQSKIEYLNSLKSEYGVAKDGPTYMPKVINYRDYLDFRMHDLSEPAAPPKGEDGQSNIYVVYGIGTITDFRESSVDFSPENLMPILDGIAKDENAKAVVMYINSPGGTVTASEMIRRKLESLRESNIDVVVSMNGVATSGAYMVASAARKILATPSTVTGSIGVFGIGFGADQLLNNYGVYQDGVSTNELAELPAAKPLSQNVMTIMELQINNTYQRFIDLVATSRSLNFDNYKEYAEGKIFVAEDAKKLKLIDDIGTLYDAIDIAVKENTLDKGKVRVIHAGMRHESKFPLLEQFIFGNLYGLLPEGVAAALLDLREGSKVLGGSLYEDRAIMAITPFRVQ